MLKIMGRKYLQFYAENVCLSKPVYLVPFSYNHLPNLLLLVMSNYGSIIARSKVLKNLNFYFIIRGSKGGGGGAGGPDPPCKI